MVRSFAVVVVSPRIVAVGSSTQATSEYTQRVAAAGRRCRQGEAGANFLTGVQALRAVDTVHTVEAALESAERAAEAE